MYNKKEDSHGVHEFRWRFHPSLDIPCVYIVAFIQRLLSGSYNVGIVPHPFQLVHLHQYARRLRNQYQFAHTPVDYSDLEVSDLLPSSVSMCPDCPRECRLEKLTSSGYVCG